MTGALVLLAWAPAPIPRDLGHHLGSSDRVCHVRGPHYLSEVAAIPPTTRLLDLGLSTDPDPIVWFTGLGVVGLNAGALALRVAARRIDGDHAPADYALAAVAGVVSMLLLARVRSCSRQPPYSCVSRPRSSPLCRCRTLTGRPPRSR